MKNLFHVIVFCIVSVGITQSLCAETFSLESRDLTMVLEKTEADNGEGLRLVSLKDRRTGQVFCQAPARPLFSVVLRSMNAPEKSHYALADAAWNSVEVRKENDALLVRWHGFKPLPEASQVQVQMRIAADPNRDGIEISQTAEAGSDQVSILNARLGQLAVSDFGDETKLFVPHRSGLVVDNPCGKRYSWSSLYPGFNCAMPWFVVWKDKALEDGFRSTDNVGLYVGFHDVQGSRKRPAGHARNKSEKEQWPDTVSFWAEIETENYGQANNKLNIGGKAVLRSIRNDWQDGAAIYRDWVRREASWYPRDRMDENGRTDSPLWFKEHCLWAMYRVGPDEMTRAMKKMQTAFGVPAAVHWYYWQNNPFGYPNPHDNDYPHFRPRPGFDEAVTEMQKDGNIFVMPYINGLLWDTRDRDMEDWRYTEEGKPLAVKKEDGTITLHSYGSKENDGSDVKFANMCPATEGWQKKVRENVLRLLNESGTKLVYIDQVAAHTPDFCFDPDHGHPFGGGHWWGDGYRKMFKIIRADMHREIDDHPFCEAVRKQLAENPNALRERAITTECTGETSLDIFDGFLTWHHQVENQVPAFAAVYGGTIQMIGRDYRAGKTYAERTEPTMPHTNEPLACRMKAGEALCFGEQLGWFVPTIIDEADKFPFQRNAVRLRYQLRHYFYKGEMARTPEFPLDLPKMTADWNFYDSPPFTAPAIQSGCWRIVKNGQTQSAVLLFANTSNEPITTRVRIDLAAIGFEGSIKIRRIGPEGFEKDVDPKSLNESVEFPGQAVFAWEIIAD